MSVYDKNSPMNDILVRGEEARRRRSKKRRLHPEEITVDPSVRLRPHESVEEGISYSNWFTEMISYPCQKNLSKLESFTALSAIVVYLPLNLFLLLNPVQSCSSINDNMTLKQCVKVQGLVRIIGMHVYCIVFLYVIFCRASSRLPASGIILGTLLSRTIYAVSAGYLLYVRNYIPINVLYSIMVIDCGLAALSIGFWLFQPKDGTTKTFFGSIWHLVKPSNPLTHTSSAVVYILGLVQSISSLLCIIVPRLAFQLLKIDAKEFNNHSMGFYSLSLMGSAAIGFIHVLSGGADSNSFNIAAVFYRVFFTLPLMGYIGAMQQVPLGLSLYFICLDGFFALAVFIALCGESTKTKTQ